jgi:choloylglycine hydrolase
VRLSEIDFSNEAGFRKLPIAGGHYYAGDATDKFEKAEPFKFMTVPGS